MTLTEARGYSLLFILMFMMVSASCSLLAAEQAANAQHNDKSGQLYPPSDDAMVDLNNILEKAKRTHKLALIIFGANWCHDSLGLAARLQAEPLKSLLEEHYETLLVNVGNLSEGREVIQRLGVPIYYATPTVLIVDPLTGNLVNEGNRHMWANADSVSMDDSVSYFQLMADTDLAALTANLDYTAEQARLMADIDEFEQVQADRLAQAYIITGAMLEEDFDQAVWREVGQYRNSVANDVDALRAEVANRVANGETDIVLTYPSYSDWSWSSESNVEGEPKNP